MPSLSGWGRVLLLGLASLFVNVGCGEVVDDVDRVQPHYIKKSNLEGEWFYRQTMVDRPPQYLYLFTGIEGALEKIRWEVRETQLIAYRIHEAVRGLDDDANIEGAEFKGDPVAIFQQPILLIARFSHKVSGCGVFGRESLDFCFNFWTLMYSILLNRS